MTGSPAPTLEKPRTIARLIRATSRRVAAARRETTLAVGALVVIAVHLLDDNFVQPEPGTSAADHLVSGLVPLAALLAFASAYPRLRAGLRAAIAIPLGVLAIVAGVGEAGYYTLQSAHRETTTPACSRFPPASCCSPSAARSSGRRDALTTAFTGATCGGSY